MFDDRKLQAPYAVIFSPGQSIGTVKRMTPAEASATVGGFASQSAWGNDLVVYHARKALADTLEPNRMFDGRAINGPMIVMGVKKSMSGRKAVELAQDCPWKMVQVERRNVV